MLRPTSEIVAAEEDAGCRRWSNVADVFEVNGFREIDLRYQPRGAVVDRGTGTFLRVATALFSATDSRVHT